MTDLLWARLRRDQSVKYDILRRDTYSTTAGASLATIAGSSALGTVCSVHFEVGFCLLSLWDVLFLGGYVGKSEVVECWRGE
jgi:hypothetical protein